MSSLKSLTCSKLIYLFDTLGKYLFSEMKSGSKLFLPYMQEGMRGMILILRRLCELCLINNRDISKKNLGSLE